VQEVWLELSSGSRVLVGVDLPDVASAMEVARRWKAIAESGGGELVETLPNSGCVVRGSAIVAIKVQPQPKARLLDGVLNTERPGRWL